MKSYWYILIVGFILLFIYLNTPIEDEQAGDIEQIQLNSTRYLNWSRVRMKHSDFVNGHLEARLLNYSTTDKKIYSLANGSFVGKVYITNKMRYGVFKVEGGGFDGDYVGDLQDDIFKGNVSGQSVEWLLDGRVEPERVVVTEPSETIDWTLAFFLTCALGVGYYLLQRDGVSKKKLFDDAEIDRRLRLWINSEYSKQVWQVRKHKSVPEDDPQWVKIHFKLLEPRGLDCVTIFRLKGHYFTDTEFGLKPYQVEAFFSRKILYEGSGGSIHRRPGRPPKEETDTIFKDNK